MPTITQRRLFDASVQPKRRNARDTRITTTAVLAEWLNYIAAKRQEGADWDAIADGLAKAGVRSAATGSVLSGATVSAYYSRLRRRSKGDDSMPALRARLAALEATLTQQQAEAVQALAARDRAVSAQGVAESDAAWLKVRWTEAGKKAATAEAGRAEALEAQKALESQLAATRAEAAQMVQERNLARAEGDKAKTEVKALTEQLIALESRLAAAESERDKARGGAAQIAQERDAAVAGRDQALEAQKALESRLATVEGEWDTARAEADQIAQKRAAAEADRDQALEALDKLRGRLRVLSESIPPSQIPPFPAAQAWAAAIRHPDVFAALFAHLSTRADPCPQILNIIRDAAYDIGQIIPDNNPLIAQELQSLIVTLSRSDIARHHIIYPLIASILAHPLVDEVRALASP